MHMGGYYNKKRKILKLFKLSSSIRQFSHPVYHTCSNMPFKGLNSILKLSFNYLYVAEFRRFKQL